MQSPLGWESREALFPMARPHTCSGAAGLHQFVRLVGRTFTVWDKDGDHAVPLLGPVRADAPFEGVHGTGCFGNANGVREGTVIYDKAAARWIVQGAAYPEVVGDKPFYWFCTAASKTEDARGGYYAYAFKVPFVFLRPVLGVWTESYVVTTRVYLSTNFSENFRPSPFRGSLRSLSCWPPSFHRYCALGPVQPHRRPPTTSSQSVQCIQTVTRLFRFWISTSFTSAGLTTVPEWKVILPWTLRWPPQLAVPSETPASSRKVRRLGSRPTAFHPCPQWHIGVCATRRASSPTSQHQPMTRAPLA